MWLCEALTRDWCQRRWCGCWWWWKKEEVFLGVELLDDTTLSFTWIQPMKFNHVIIHVRSTWSCWVLIRCFALLQFRFYALVSRACVPFSKWEKAKKSHWFVADYLRIENFGIPPKWKPFYYLYIHQSAILLSFLKQKKKKSILVPSLILVIIRKILTNTLNWLTIHLNKGFMEKN